MKRLVILIVVLFSAVFANAQSGAKHNMLRMQDLGTSIVHVTRDFLYNDSSSRGDRFPVIHSFEPNLVSRIDSIQFYSEAVGQQRKMRVYFPCGKYDNCDLEKKTLPVIYFLHGAAGDDSSYVPKVRPVLDELILQGKIDPVIVVFPDGGVPLSEINPFLGSFVNLNVGSFYTNSELYGNFEDFIVHEIVDFIDSRYNTISGREGRFIMGHSMGGYGAMKLALKHSDVFLGAVSHSGPLDLSQLPLLIPRIKRANNGPPYNYFPVKSLNPLRYDLLTVLAHMMAGAFTPNPSANFILPVDFPLDKQGEIVPEVFERWLVHNPARIAKTLPTHPDLALYIDIGRFDELGIFPLNTAFSDTLNALGIKHAFQTFSGRHDLRFDRLRISLDFVNKAFKTPTLPPNLVFLAEEKVEIERRTYSEGDIISNGDIEFDDGNESIHTGKLTAENIDVNSGNKIYGDAIVEGKIEGKNRIFGEIRENVEIAPFSLPNPDFTVDGEDVNIDSKESVILAPDSYGDLETGKFSTIYLSRGVYYFNSFIVDKYSKIIADVTNGAVKINVVGEVSFERGVETVILPSGEQGSKMFAINCLDDSDVKIRTSSRFLGSIVAPHAEVSLSKHVVFKGTICARSISTSKFAEFYSHASTTPLPKQNLLANAENAELSVGEALPVSFTLEQNYPNPFNPETTIHFALPSQTHVTLKIYNSLGQEVRTLVDDIKPAGKHRAVWNGRDAADRILSTGIYIYVMQAGDYRDMKKMAFTK